MSKPLAPVRVTPSTPRFSDLIDEAYVGPAVVESLLGISRSSIDRRVKSGDLPQPKKFGRSVRFNVGALRRTLGT